MTEQVGGSSRTGRKGKRVLEWFSRSQALAEARAFRTRLPAAEREALQHALVAQELADRALEPVDPLRNGSSLGLAVSLYREAAYWALAAQSSEHQGSTLAELFTRTPQDLLERAAGGAEQLAEVRRALVERSFVETAALPRELLPEEAERARSFVQALLERRLAPEARVHRLLLQRYVRCGAVLLLLVAGLVVAFTVAQKFRKGPDLAQGKPWRASTSTDVCHPARRRCAGVTTGMFFTTAEEVDPWLEIDLGRPMTFNQVEVENRDDCCPDRVVPLVVEVGNDQKTWREVARRQDTFSAWEAQIASQNARYVRLHVPRRTILHLNKVAVRNVR